MTNAELLKRIYNAFDPTRPLSAGDDAYVDYQDVRGDRDILLEVGRDIELSDSPTCRLYAGHRGAGKSTELLRLSPHLENEGFQVVYFPADAEDIDPEDARYTDILLACTRRLLQELNPGNDNPVMRWLKDRWQSLKTLATSEVELEDLTIEVFSTITANLRAVPSIRQQVRKLVDPHTVTLLQALNELIDDAKSRQTDTDHSGIVLIADNLDRIVPVTDTDTGRTNHDEIFLDRSEQLKALHCHVVYTVPISMVYSSSGTHLVDSYGPVRVLPMVTVRRRALGKRTPGECEPNARGIARLRELIERRIHQIRGDITLNEVFEDLDTLDHLCLMSGGHLRNLILLLRTSVERAPNLPVPQHAMLRAISELRETYNRTIAEDEWGKLADVYRTQAIANTDAYRKLLFNRCILEYREMGDDQSVVTWYDIHPVIEDIPQFRRALENA
jgi:hypothetical protein